MKKPELLAPAGNLEKLKMAFTYGADAVYVGGESFSLRAAADNFTLKDMEEGIKFARQRGKKVYAAVNIFPHNDDINNLAQYVKDISCLGVDAIIASDPGAFEIIREVAPDMEIHISTQANTVNWKSAEFWYKLGAKRIVLSRELSFEQISEIRRKTSDNLELEAFVHGAMCVSYSGRCLLSSYMTGRDANKGECAQPCRWKYYLMEEKRPGEYFPVYEQSDGSDQIGNGTFILNSKDLCMIEYIPQLINSGVASFKIEGRVKTSYYVSIVVKAYREAIDLYFAGEEFSADLLNELKTVSHRNYGTGFYLKKPQSDMQVYNDSSYIRNYDIVGMVQGYDQQSKCIIVSQRNKFKIGDNVEFVQPGIKGFVPYKVTRMTDQSNQDIDAASHAQMTVKLPSEQKLLPLTIMRKAVLNDKLS